MPKFLRRLLKTSRFWQDNYILLREFKNFRRIAILAFVFTVSAAVFEGITIGLLLSFLQSLTEPNGAAVTTGINWIDTVILGANRSVQTRIYQISLFLILTTLVRGGLFYLGKLCSGFAQAELSYQLKIKIFEQLQSLKLSYFSKTRSGSLVNTVTNEIIQLKQVFDLMSNILVKASNLIVYIVSMFLLSWQLTTMSLMLFSLLTVGVSTLFKRIREISFARTKANSRFTSVALELISGIRTIQGSVAQDFERRKFFAVSNEIEKVEKQSAVFQAGVEPITLTASTIVLLGILLFAYTFLITSGQLKVATLFTFLIILFRLVPVVRLLNGQRAKLINFQGSIDNIKQLLRTDDKPYLENGTLPFTQLHRGITFRGVDFAYESGSPILQNINLTLERGQVTAFVGASGAGKTTLADLIPRFYEPTAGLIRLDGRDIRDFEIDSIRRRMAIVSQDTFIFNTTIANNIAYGLDNVSEAEIWQAAAQANALEFIQEMPDGLNTELGDRGTRLSGGQRQRIAIARALLRNPEILILDEATSALDSVSEKLIQQSLEKLTVGRTVITIAHRLSTIAKADKVVVLEQGRIVEQGSYRELLSLQGKLWKYHQTQHEMSGVDYN
ncbi:MAG: heterocyst formation ABC transporter subunit HepA [Cyanobacteria bacterium J06631_2]